MSAADTPALLGRVPARIAERGPAWLVGLRQKAADRLHAEGFPTRRTEAWRFTPVKPVVSVPFAPDAPAVATDWTAWVEARLGADDTYRVILVNGRPLAAGQPPAGVRVEALARILAEDPGRVEPYLGWHARAEHFAALNAALFDDGLVVTIDVEADVDRPIHLVHVAAPGTAPTAAYPRLVVVAGRGSQAQLIETYLAAEGEHQHLTDVVTEVSVGENARLDHTRVAEGQARSYHVGALAVRQERDSRYASRVVALGGALYRLDLDMLMAGDGADCTLDGIYHVAGRDHVDHHVYVDHAVPHCSSRQHYRGLLDDAGRAVFDGTVIVRRDAQQSSAHQQNHNLLLSDEAGVNTKPHLEIDADDVSCSHGATIGALDDASMFYLRARGIDEAQAEAMLTYAFVREIIDDIPHAPVRERLARLLRERLPHGETLGDIE